MADARLVGAYPGFATLEKVRAKPGGRRTLWGKIRAKLGKLGASANPGTVYAPKRDSGHPGTFTGHSRACPGSL